jgi:hypothetical protein
LFTIFSTTIVALVTNIAIRNAMKRDTHYVCTPWCRAVLVGKRARALCDEIAARACVSARTGSCRVIRIEWRSKHHAFLDPRCNVSDVT